MTTGNGAKEYFMECRRMEKRIDGMVNEAHRLRDLACSMTANYSDMPRSGSGSRSRVEEAMLKVVALEQEINAEIDVMTDHRRKARQVLGQLSDERFRDVLTWRYFSLWPWDRITEALGYSDRTQAWRLHGRALQEANKLLRE